MVSLVSVMLFATFALAQTPQAPAKDKTTKDAKGTTMTTKSGHTCTKDGKTCTGMAGKDGCCKEKEGSASKTTTDDKGKK